MCEPLNNLWTLCQVLSEQMGIRAMSATVRLIEPWHNPNRRSHVLLQYNQDFRNRVHGTLKRLFRERSPRMGHLALSPLGRELFKAAVRKPAGSDHVCLSGLGEGHKIPPNPELVLGIRKPVTMLTPTANWVAGDQDFQHERKGNWRGWKGQKIPLPTYRR